MKLKKKEGQSVDTLLLLRRQNKRSQPVHMSQALQSRGSNPQSSGSRLLVSTVGLVMPSAASGWSPSRAGGQLHAQRLAGRRQPVYLVPALQSRWSSPEASDRCLPISPWTRSTLSHWSWCRRSAIHRATCEGETASTTCILHPEQVKATEILSLGPALRTVRRGVLPSWLPDHREIWKLKAHRRFKHQLVTTRPINFRDNQMGKGKCRNVTNRN